MPRDSNGNYTKPNPSVVAGTTVQAAYENTNTDDQATELTDSLSRSGKGAMLAALKVFDDAIEFANEATTTLRRAASGDLRLNLLGSEALAITSALAAFSGALRAADGGLTFSQEPTSGLRRAGASDVRLDVAGNAVFQALATGAVALDGRTNALTPVFQLGIAATQAELEGYTGQQAGELRQVLDRATFADGGGGLFRWDPSNQSANVTLDTRKVIWVPPTSDATGASGAWVRQFDGPMDIRWAGALTSETENQPAIQGCLTLERTLHTGVYVPDGTWNTLTECTMAGSGMKIFGKSIFRSRIRTNANVIALNIGTGLVGTQYQFNTIERLSFQCTGTGGYTNTAISGTYCPNSRIRDVYINEFRDGIVLNNSWNSLLHGCGIFFVRRYAYDLQIATNDVAMVNCTGECNDSAGSRCVRMESCHGNSITGGAFENAEIAFTIDASEVSIDAYAESNTTSIIEMIGAAAMVNVVNMYSFNNGIQDNVRGVAGKIIVHQWQDLTPTTPPPKFFSLTGGAQAYYGNLNLPATVRLGTCEQINGGRIAPLFGIAPTRWTSELIQLSPSATTRLLVGRIARPWKFGRVVVYRMSGTMGASTVRLGNEDNNTSLGSSTVVEGQSYNVPYTQPAAPYTQQTGFLFVEITGGAAVTGTVQIQIDIYQGHLGDDLPSIADMVEFIAAAGVDGQTVPRNSLN